MKIRELNIRDFGIIKNESIKDLNSNIVVIGGLNRAGKSTFMKIIRHLLYGFKRGKDYKLPQSEHEYYVVSQIDHHNKRYIVKDRAYSDAAIEDNEGNEIKVEAIHNNIDFYTYKNLYTISLDELRKDVTFDDNKFKPIILGTGLKSMMKINEASKEFARRAESIGGTQGKLEVGKFKEYNKKINNLIKEKKKINNQRQTYKELNDKIQNIDNEIRVSTEKIEKLNEQIRINMFIKENYSDYRSIQGEQRSHLEEFLKENKLFGNNETLIKELIKDYECSLKRYEEAKDRIELTIDNNVENLSGFEIYRDKILSKGKAIDKFREDIGIINESQSNLMRRKEKLYLELKSINSNFRNIQEIRQMTFDKQREEILKHTCHEYENIKREISKKELEITSVKGKRQGLKESSDDLGNKESKGINSYTIALIGVIVLGGVMFFVSSILGIAMILGGMISILGFQILMHLRHKESFRGTKLIDEQIAQLLVEENANNQEILKLREEFKALEEYVDEFREEYKIEYNSPLQYMIEVFYRLRALQDNAKELALDEKKMLLMKKNLGMHLSEIRELISSLSIKINKYRVEDISDSKVMELLETILNDYYNYENFQKVLNEKCNIEEKISKIFRKNQVIENYLEFLREALELAREFESKKNRKIRLDTIENKLRQSFINLNCNIKNLNANSYEELFINYLSIEEVEQIGGDLKREHEIAQETKEKLIKNKIQIEEKLSIMESEESLKDIMQNIQREQNNLKALGEEYAINKASQKILQKVLEKIVDETKNNVVGSWSDIINNITNGDINKIDLDIKEDKLIYNLYSKENTMPTDVELLSRGTAEQVFLSARLNRLKNIDVNLPIVFDDAFVNFDSGHMRNVLKELEIISEKKQIFILTCHKEVIEAISKEISYAQYLYMEKGKIMKSTAEVICSKLT